MRFCEIHCKTATSFKDDSPLMDENENPPTKKMKLNEENEDWLPTDILNTKTTRNGNFYEVLSFIVAKMHATLYNINFIISILSSIYSHQATQ